MRHAVVRIRAFLLGTVLLLALLPTVAGLGAWQIERHRQQGEIQRRLNTAFAYLEAHRRQITKPGTVRAFAAMLPRLELFAQVNLIMKLPPGKTTVYLSPALNPVPTRIRAPAGASAAASAKARRAEEVPLSAGTKSPATSEKSAERVIPLITRTSAGAITADLYYPPPSRSDQALAGLATGLAVLLAGLAFVLWIAGRWMVAPLRSLSAQVDKVAGGDLAIAVPDSRIGEIATIAQAVEGMTVALGETAQRRTEADEARRFLVTSVAHDLRTPLFALRGHLQAVQSGIGETSVHLERAEARADALERLIGNLFAFTRDDYAQPTLQLESLAVADVLEEVTSALEHAARLGGNGFELSGDPAIGVYGDRDRLKRALTNILDNALRYSPHGATVAVAWATDTDARVAIVVCDEGPGIDIDLLPHIFEPGIRDTVAAADVDAGAGLGLAIAKRLLEAQAGTVSAGNRPDGGAEIRLTLPRARSDGP